MPVNPEDKMHHAPAAGGTDSENALAARLRRALQAPTLTDALIRRGAWLRATCRGTESRIHPPAVSTMRRR